MFSLARYYKGRYVQYAREQEDKAGKARPRDETAGVMYYLSDDDIGGYTDDAAQQLAENIGLAEAWGGDGYLDEGLIFVGMHLEDWFRMLTLTRYYKERYVLHAREQKKRAAKPTFVTSRSR
jgi:hypothetical protein